MKTMKSTARLSLIVYICTFLTGAPFVLSASAKITPKDVNGGTQLITIKKGDTLWALAKKYLNDPFKWNELREYNEFTNPDMIYPQEELRIPAAVARRVLDTEIFEAAVTKAEIEELKAQVESASKGVTASAETLKSLKTEIEELRNQNQELHESLKSLSTEVQDAAKSDTQAIEQLDASLNAKRQATQKEIAAIGSQIATLEKNLDEKTADLGRYQMGVDALNASIQSLAAGLEQNQKAMAELKEKIREAEGPTEEPTKSKRAFAIVAAMAGGVAWLVVNAIGSSD
ncbi:MAG: LysM peptidoglycan-binding domain-containing protein [Candidatus Poribacteria bacterium]|nr:LysM peptidoglycan-binding domain-containing protein [Candidatus Poribacteria bacterium]